MDPLDEFEFKPLTEGLGFHKKAAPRKETPTASRSNVQETPRPVSRSISDLMASLPPTLDFIDGKTDGNAELSDEASFDLETSVHLPPPMSSLKAPLKAPVSASSHPKIFQPLAREDYAPAAKSLTMPASTTGSVKTSMYREQMDQGLARAFPHVAVPTDRSAERSARVIKQKSKSSAVRQETATGLQPVSAHFGSCFLDAMVVSGMGTVLLVCILSITRVNLIGLLSNAQTDSPTQIHLLLLFVAVLQLYMLTARSFFGASLGEWAFELQLGSEKDQRELMYPIRVAWRSLLMTLTGLIVLPLASLIAGKDIASYLTGVQLYRKP